jgi:hypothetical protein
MTLSDKKAWRAVAYLKRLWSAYWSGVRKPLTPDEKDEWIL